MMFDKLGKQDARACTALAVAADDMAERLDVTLIAAEAYYTAREPAWRGSAAGHAHRSWICLLIQGVVECENLARHCSRLVRPSDRKGG